MKNYLLYFLTAINLISHLECYDVLMVIGGMSVENGMRNTHR